MSPVKLEYRKLSLITRPMTNSRQFKRGKGLNPCAQENIRQLSRAQGLSLCMQGESPRCTNETPTSKYAKAKITRGNRGKRGLVKMLLFVVVWPPDPDKKKDKMTSSSSKTPKQMVVVVE